MNTREIQVLTEAINYVKHAKSIRELIREGIVEAISNLGPSSDYDTSSRYERYRHGVNADSSDASMTSTIQDELKTRLMWSVGERLKNVATRILELPQGSGYIPVDFKSNMWAHGEATGLSVALNDEFIRVLVRRVYDMISMVVYDNWEGGKNFYSWYWNFIRRYPWAKRIADSFRLQDIIEHWADVFIHELVHVRQHLPQYQRGKTDTEYRSYLERYRGEFLEVYEKNSALENPSERWWELYRASPQEIDAFAHDIALKILRSYIDEPGDLEFFTQADRQDLYRSVPAYIFSHYKKPENAAEVKVFRRYLRRTIQKIGDYLEHNQNNNKNGNSD